MFTVLFTSIGRRVELVQAFKNLYLQHNIPARILGVDANPELAPAGYYTDAVFRVPRVNETEYLDALLEICRLEKVDLLIPLYEPEFLLLYQHRNALSQLGSYLLLSRKETLEVCANKFKMYSFFMEHSIQTPVTWQAEDLPPVEKFPLFVKPRTGMGSIGAQKVYSLAQLNLLLNQNPELIIQEYVSGMEYTLDVLSDLDGQVLSVVPRERLEVRSGEVVKSRTIRRQDLIEQGKLIAESIGLIGPGTIQCIDTGNQIFWIEVNPRFGGGVPLSIKAGVDYPYMLYQMCQGEKVQPMIDQFKDDLVMLRYDQAVYLEATKKCN